MSSEAKYDESRFANAVRGQHGKAYQSATSIVRLVPDVDADFPDDQAVNMALRFVQKLAKDAGCLTRRGG